MASPTCLLLDGIVEKYDTRIREVAGEQIRSIVVLLETGSINRNTARSFRKHYDGPHTYLECIEAGTGNDSQSHLGYDDGELLAHYRHIDALVLPHSEEALAMIRNGVRLLAEIELDEKAAIGSISSRTFRRLKSYVVPNAVYRLTPAQVYVAEKELPLVEALIGEHC